MRMTFKCVSVAIVDDVAFTATLAAQAPDPDDISALHPHTAPAYGCGPVVLAVKFRPPMTFIVGALYDFDGTMRWVR